MSNTNNNFQDQTSNAFHNAIMKAGGKDGPPMLAPVNVVGDKENVGTQVVQQSGIQCYNCKEYRHVARECQMLKRAKDSAYHKEKMLLYKQEEAGFQLNADQADWRDDIDDEPDDQELKAHYMYMAKIQEVTSDAAENSGLIFNAEPLQKVQNDDDNYNVFANDTEHPEQPESFNDTYSNEQEKKKELIAHQETISIMSQEKEAQKKFYKTHEDKEIEKGIALENKVKVLDDIVYKTGQSVQTINMLNRNSKTSFVKLEFLKKSQRANPRLYDI
nr:hypothetical protein [Tanacetum cinerariifolium]